MKSTGKFEGFGVRLVGHHSMLWCGPWPSLKIAKREKSKILSATEIVKVTYEPVKIRNGK